MPPSQYSASDDGVADNAEAAKEKIVGLFKQYVQEHTLYLQERKRLVARLSERVNSLAQLQTDREKSDRAGQPFDIDLESQTDISD